jgi:hypothetical protein
MSMKLPDNFQIREHSWPCRFHIIIDNLYKYNLLMTIYLLFFQAMHNYPLLLLHTGSGFQTYERGYETLDYLCALC